MTSLSWDNQSIGAVAFSSGRLSSPRWRRVCPGCICIGFCISLGCCMHPDATDSKQRGRVRSDTTVRPCFSTYRCIQLQGNDEAVWAQCSYASFSEQAVGGSAIPRGEGVRGVCVCVCVTSHLLLNPISKAWGLNQPSPLKACQGKAHK